MSTNVTWPVIGGTTYSVPASGEVNWASLSNFLIALGNAAQGTTNQKSAIRVATTTPVTVSATNDCVVAVVLGTPGACVVNLPAGNAGQFFYIVDGRGDASTNNITVTPNGAETINGAATYVINKDRGGILVAYSTTGTNWYVCAEFAGTSSAAGGLVTTTNTVTLTNKTMDGDNNTFQDLAITVLKTVIGQASTFLSFDGSGAPIATKAVPTGVVLGTTDTQTVTNKNLASATNTLTGATAGSFTNTGTVTLFTASDTVVGRATTDTLSNKTIASPTVTGTLLLQNPSGSQPTLRMSEDPDNGTNYLEFQAAAAMAGNVVYTWPDIQGGATTYLTNNGSGVLSWGGVSGALDSILTAQNYTLTAAVGSSALTLALKTKAGTDAQASDPIPVAFRNATSATGDYSVVSIQAAMSVVVSSGSTLGNTSAVATYLYVYLINNAGTAELAISTKRFDDGSIVSTTAEGGAGAADSAILMYSATARTNVACKLIARLNSTQTTAGTWAAVPTEISLGNKFITDPRIGAINALNSPTGYVGETQLVQVMRNANTVSLNNNGDVSYIGSLNLTRGVWLMEAMLGWTCGSTVAVRNVAGGIRLTNGTGNPSGDTFNNITLNESWKFDTYPVATYTPGAGDHYIATISYVAKTDATTLFYLGGAVETSTASTNWLYGGMQATRLV